MDSPHTPAERETPAGEAMREAVARVIRQFVSSRSNPDGSWTRVLSVTPEMLASVLASSAGPIASELARLTAERDEGRAAMRFARTEETHERRRADQLQAALTSHRAEHAAGQIDLCNLRKEVAEHAAEVARRDAEIARLKAQTPFVVTNGEHGEDERFRMWSGRAWVWVKPVGYAALFIRKRDANQILPDGDPHDYPDRIRALTLKEAGHE